MIIVYNEESRIRYPLEQALKWADEIIVINKSSTDKTKEICEEEKYKNKVKVIDIPFSLAGSEDTVSIMKLPKNEWVFLSTASEIPTKKLISKINDILKIKAEQLSLIYVPRKMYSFGIHSRKSPWNILYYPFLINKSKANIKNTIHENFSTNNKKETYRIKYSNDCCVHHFTHTSAFNYINTMNQYFIAETNNTNNYQEKINECFSAIKSYEKKLVNGNDELFGHYCAWNIYWLGTALHIWEKQRELNVPEYYNQIKENLLKNEWQTSVNPNIQNQQHDKKYKKIINPFKNPILKLIAKLNNKLE
jgi:hypothetical protein